MPNVSIDLINALAERWSTAMVAVSLDATLLLLGVGLAWLAIRRRVAPQVGYGLFLLVPLKLLLPVVVPIPEVLAAWTPSAQVQTWFQPVPAGPTRVIPAVPVAFSMAPPPPAVSLADRSTTPRPDLPAARPATLIIPSAATHKPLLLEPTPRLSPAALVILVWLVGVVVCLIRFGQVQAAFRVRLRRATPIDPSRFAVDLIDLCRRAGVRRSVRFVELDSLASPAVWGIWRPTLILPQGIETALRPTQLRWVLLHELAHIERRDLAVALLQRIAAIVHFFNPLVWVANRIINQLREYACDDRATALEQASPVEAGEAFVGVLRLADRSRRGLQGTLGIAGLDSRSGCFQRVNRLLDGDRPIRTRANWPARLALVLVAVLVLPHFRGMSAAGPTAPAAKPVFQVQPEAQVTDAKPVATDFALTVVDPDGKPIPGAVVDFWSRPLLTADKVRVGTFLPRRADLAVVQANGSGRITVSLPPPCENLVISIQIPGFGPYHGSWDSRDHPEPIPPQFTAQLDRAWTVGSVVNDSSGQPVAGAKVQLRFESKKRPGDVRQLGAGAYATTDAEGRWSYRSVPVALLEVEADIRHPNFSTTTRSLPRSGFGIESGAEPTGEVRLGRGLTITGKVSDESGRPIAQACVRATFENTVAQAKTEADGSYKLAGCDPITTQIVTTATGHAPDIRKVIVTPDQGSVDISLKPAVTVRVRVLDHEGNPLAGSRVSLTKWRGESLFRQFVGLNSLADEEGRWTWTDAPRDEFRVGISPPHREGLYLLDVPLTAREEEYLIRLPAPVVISGGVTDAATGSPIAKFRVVPGNRTRPKHKDWVEGNGFAGKDGRYEYRPEFAFPAHLIRIEADGYLPAESREIASDEGTVTVTVNFALERGSNVAGRVLTPDGQPAAGAEVVLGLDGKQISLQNGRFDSLTFTPHATTDASGMFQFPPQAQPFAVVIVHPTGFAQVGSVPAWGALQEIRLEAWSRLTGTFRENGQPARDIPLRLEAMRRQTLGGSPHIFIHYEATTGPSGQYVFDRVIPGYGSVGRRILLTVDDGAREITSSTMTPMRMPAGETTTVDLGGSGRPVVGKLLPVPGYQGKVAWNFASVEAHLADKPESGFTSGFYATVGPDGSFRVDDAPPGKYLMTVRFEKSEPGMIWRHPFEVPLLEADTARTPVDLGSLQLVTPAIR